MDESTEPKTDEVADEVPKVDEVAVEAPEADDVADEVPKADEVAVEAPEADDVKPAEAPEADDVKPAEAPECDEELPEEEVKPEEEVEAPEDEAEVTAEETEAPAEETEAPEEKAGATEEEAGATEEEAMKEEEAPKDEEAEGEKDEAKKKDDSAETPSKDVEMKDAPISSTKRKAGRPKKVKAKKDEPQAEEDSAETPAKDAEMEDAPASPDEKKKRKATPDSGSKSPIKRERRSRKSAEAFKPDNFLNVDKTVEIIPGRGKELSELEATRESIESHAAGSEDIVQAHRLLFKARSKAAKKDMKANILAFSGYLPLKDKGIDKKKQDAIDEEFEAKMGAKTYKLTVPQLKKICDFFAIDRSNVNGKDPLVDVLLDFLGEPSEDLMKGGKAKKSESSSTGKKKGKAKKEVEEEDPADYSDVDDEKVGKTTADGEGPSDDALRKWVRAYVRCHNMKKSTIKHALEIAGDKFGVDLLEKKHRLKELLTEEM